MRLLLLVVALTAALVRKVEHVPPKLSDPPPAYVTDIHGKRVELPFATSADDANACVKAFASGAHRGEVGNDQQPYSSHGEDMAALERFGPQRRSAWSDDRRVFLEIGAFDGVTESNTILLERCLGWRGVLVEANPRAWTSLKGAGRNHARLVHAAPMCAHPNASSVVQMEVSDFTSASIGNGSEPGTTRAPVPCVSLTRLLQNALGAPSRGSKSGPKPRVDFFSLDVENTEDLVLATLDFEAIDVALLFVESDNRMCPRLFCPKRDAVRARMAAAGYVLNPFEVGSSDVFLRPDLMLAESARRLLGFKLPS